MAARTGAAFRDRATVNGLIFPRSPLHLLF
jgi:hypothetical protein